MNHQSVRHTGGRFIALLVAAVMLATTCLASWPVTGTCSYAYAAETPGKITGLKLKVTSSPSAMLTWDKLDCDGYKVYRGSKAIARVKAGDADDVVTYTDEGIEPGESYTYLVRPYNGEAGKEVYGAYSSAVKIVKGYTYATAAGAETAAAAAEAPPPSSPPLAMAMLLEFPEKSFTVWVLLLRMVMFSTLSSVFPEST